MHYTDMDYTDMDYTQITYRNDIRTYLARMLRVSQKRCLEANNCILVLG